MQLGVVIEDGFLIDGKLISNESYKNLPTDSLPCIQHQVRAAVLAAHLSLMKFAALTLTAHNLLILNMYCILLRSSALFMFCIGTKGYCNLPGAIVSLERRSHFLGALGAVPGSHLQRTSVQVHVGSNRSDRYA